MRKILFIGFAIGLTAGYIVFLFIFTDLIKEQQNPKMSGRPYYSDDAFKLPKDVELSEKLTPKPVPLTEIHLPIVMYHYVEYVKDVRDVIRRRLNINPNIFDGEMKALTEAHYTFFYAKDIPDILEGKTTLPEKAVVLTFDDGYEDFYTDVFPILKKYKVKATIYIIYDFIGKKGFLTDSEIREIIKSGLVEVGSHTFDHIYLKSVPHSVAYNQIVDSKKAFETRYNYEVKTFAYPYGAFSEESVQLAKEASYSAAMSVITGSTQSENNLFYLQRIRAGAFGPQNIVKVLEHYSEK